MASSRLEGREISMIEKKDEDNDRNLWKDDAVLLSYSARLARAVLGKASKGSGFIVEKIKKKQGRNALKGKLSLLLTMPADIFMDVAGHMEPIDVLHLSRISLEFNKMLMSKQSRSIWRAARVNVQMPECPDGLSEAQYISLLYEKYCQVCGTPYVPHSKKVLTLRIRLCHGCYSTNVLKGRDLTGHLPEKQSDDIRLYTLTVCSEALELSTNKGALTDIVVAKDAHFFKPDFDEALRRYMDLERHPARRNAYVENRSAIVSEVIEKAKVVQKWMGHMAEISKLAAERALLNRKLEISSRLKGIGYNETDYPIQNEEGSHYIEGKKLVENKTELKPRTWKTLRPKLEQIILQVREKRAQDALHRRIKERKTELRKFHIPYLKAQAPDLTEQALLPNLADLFALPFVYTRIHGSDARKEITQETWDALSAELPEAFRSHRDRLFERYDTLCVKDFLSMNEETDENTGSSPANAVSGSTTVGDVALITPSHPALHAYAFFNCGHSRCFTGLTSGPLPLPILLRTHRCRSLAHRGGSIDTKTRLELEALPWTDSSVSYGSMAAYIAQALLKELGVPKSTDVKRMIDCGRTFTCLGCAPIMREKMTWSELIVHFDKEYKWYDEAFMHLDGYEGEVDETSGRSSRLSYENKRPYCLTVINDHDVDEATEVLVGYDQRFDTSLIVGRASQTNGSAPNTSGDQLSGVGDVFAEEDVLGGPMGFCAICYNLHINHWMMRSAELAAHIRKK
ncbi:hypothetical protein M0805_005579 [Coniferiporia weirii]|nr:hypothetical protein M0805_005579 [Coniferiporia weirii]